MRIIEEIKERAQQNPQRIVLAEGEDERIIAAASICLQAAIAEPVLLGNARRIKDLAWGLGVDVSGIELIDPGFSVELEDYVNLYFQLRNSTRFTREGAEKLMKKPLYFAAAMVRTGDVKGMVAGCKSLSANVIRASQMMIGLKKGVSKPSSFFLMSVPGCPYGEDGNFLYADAAINAGPLPRELAEIAVLSAESARDLLGWQPRVAMLSFSTKGSSGDKLADKVREATRLAREMAPGLLIDGEFQLDAAIVPEVAERKVKESSQVAGRANVLIFPDLAAGNIAYKMTQYLAKAAAYGSLLQGLTRPVSDLSRAASVEDIVGAVSLVTIQAQKR